MTLNNNLIKNHIAYIKQQEHECLSLTRFHLQPYLKVLAFHDNKNNNELNRNHETLKTYNGKRSNGSRTKTRRIFA